MIAASAHCAVSLFLNLGFGIKLMEPEGPRAAK
jgi:hypothetical protein